MMGVLRQNKGNDMTPEQLTLLRVVIVLVTQYPGKCIGKF